MPENNITNKNIFELMEVPIEELKELSIEEFAEEINGKKVNIHPLSDYGDMLINAMNADILVKNNKISIFEWDSHIHIKLSENMIFALYSYGNNKNYRIAFEGNSPDLLISVMGGRLNENSN